MSGSSFGKLFRITTWGESHGAAVGVVIDGCPAGLPLAENEIQAFLDRRRPGQSKYTTKRAESDSVEILSGVFEGKTTGTPISLLVRNQDQRSRDYGEIAFTYRPGHADYTFKKKYGFRDYRGGGRSSGRETIGRVAGGAVASLLLRQLGISVRAYTRAVGPYTVPEEEFQFSDIEKNSLYMPSAAIAEQAEAYVSSAMAECDSCGGIIECTAEGLPAGLGEPVFDKLDALLAQAVMSCSSLVVQSLTNSFGEMLIAANVIIMRVDGFAMMPNFSFGTALTTFAGQNVGAKKYDRVRQGAKEGTLTAIGVAVLITAGILLFGRYLMEIFTQTAELVSLSVYMMRILAVGYIAMAVTQSLSGVMRGAGDTMTPMWISLITTVVIRVPLAYGIAWFTRSEAAPNGRSECIFISLLASWVLGALITLIAYRKGSWKKKALEKNTGTSAAG